MITVFDITRIYPNGEELNTFTAKKQDADKFVLDSMFMDEVQFTFKKVKMNESDFEAELLKRSKEWDRQVIQDTKCL